MVSLLHRQSFPPSTLKGKVKKAEALYQCIEGVHLYCKKIRANYLGLVLGCVFTASCKSKLNKTDLQNQATEKAKQVLMYAATLAPASPDQCSKENPEDLGGLEIALTRMSENAKSTSYLLCQGRTEKILSIQSNTPEDTSSGSLDEPNTTDEDNGLAPTPTPNPAPPSIAKEPIELYIPD